MVGIPAIPRTRTMMAMAASFWPLSNIATIETRVALLSMEGRWIDAVKKIVDGKCVTGHCSSVALAALAWSKCYTVRRSVQLQTPAGTWNKSVPCFGMLLVETETNSAAQTVVVSRVLRQPEARKNQSPALGTRLHWRLNSSAYEADEMMRDAQASSNQDL